MVLTAERRRARPPGKIAVLPSLLPFPYNIFSVKTCLIVALGVSTVFKNRRREQRGSHFKITFPFHLPS